MAVSLKQLDELISDCEQRLAKARQKLKSAEDNVAEIEAELRGYRVARDGVSGVSNTTRGKSQTDRARGPSYAWRQIFQFILSRHDKGATIDEIERFIEEQSLDIRRGAIRSQLSYYQEKGALERIGDAQYKLTPAGAVSISLPGAIETPDR